jgi:caffeoyl-CoA O-methyltransferase
MNSSLWQVLSTLEKQSKLERLGKVPVSREKMMLAITYDTGLFFYIFLKAMKAKKILEIGTSCGYSTLWFAEAVLLLQTSDLDKKITPKKPLITIESDPLKVKRASMNFSNAGVKDIIDIMEGPAMEILLKLSRNFNNENLFDFIFIDADKEYLREYFDLVLPMVRVGGIVATDNVLYPEEYRSIMKSFLKYIRSKPNVRSVTVPIGHGEEITIKSSST